MDLSQLSEQQMAQMAQMWQAFNSVQGGSPIPASPSVSSRIARPSPFGGSSSSEVASPDFVRNGQRSSLAASSPHTTFSVSSAPITQSTILSNQHSAGLQSPQPMSPAFRPYESVRALHSFPAASRGHPAAPSSSAAPSLFPGFERLAAGSSSYQVNQQRLASSAAQNPRPPPRQVRVRRRGPAVQPMSLSAHALSPPSIQNCVTTVFGTDGVSTILLRVKVKVYPPQVTRQDLFLYRFLRQSFNHMLEENDLIHHYHLPPTTSVTAVMEAVVRDMQVSEKQYRFVQNDDNHLLNHERLPFQLLGLVNKGNARGRDGLVRLKRMAHASDLTVGAMAENRNLYAHPELCVENGEFIIHLVVRLFPLSGFTVISANAPRRRHCCISLRVYAKFPRDDHIGRSTDEDQGETSGGESESEVEDILAGGIAISSSLTPVTPSMSSYGAVAGPSSLVTAQDVPSAPSSVTVGSSTGAAMQLSLPVQRTLSFPSMRSLPERIWAVPWIPERIEDENLFSIDNLSSSVYAAAAKGSRVPKLEVRGGPDLAGLVKSFKEHLSAAITASDFTELLSPRRSFQIIEQDENGFDNVRSVGAGIEREVLETVFQEFRDESSRWFNPRADGLASITTMHSMRTARFLSPSREHDLKCLGSITALLLSNTIAPTPLDPVLLQFIIHECNLHAIHSAFLGEWHAELQLKLHEWLEAGANGDISAFRSHFMTYHELQPECLVDRNERGHQAMAAEMLYRAVVGESPHEHPEFQAFISGFRLPCRNGFSFFQVPKSFGGGPEAFFSLIWTSHISSPSDLRDHLEIITTSLSVAASSSLARLGQGLTCESLFTDFLGGAGIPCPDLFHDAKNHFNPIVLRQLDLVEEIGFRARMFNWAATGSTAIALGEGKICVAFVGDNDSSYGDSSAGRAAMVAEGKICFRTCSRYARIPLSYLIQLVHRTYSDSSQPHNFRDAVNHWLLIEVLNAIGSHSIY